MDAKSILVCAGMLGGFGGFVWATAEPAMTTLTMSGEEREAIEMSVYYAGCDEVRAAGKDPIFIGQPGYRREMDGDSDGIACEPHRY